VNVAAPTAHGARHGLHPGDAGTDPIGQSQGISRYLYSKVNSAPSYTLKNWLFGESIHDSVDLRIEISGPEHAEVPAALMS